jgi:hypothetical protein
VSLGFGLLELGDILGGQALDNVFDAKAWHGSRRIEARIEGQYGVMIVASAQAVANSPDRAVGLPFG